MNLYKDLSNQHSNNGSRTLLCTYNRYLFGDSDKCLEHLTDCLNKSILTVLALSQGQNEASQQLFSQDTSSMSAGSSKSSSQRVYMIYSKKQGEKQRANA